MTWRSARLPRNDFLSPLDTPSAQLMADLHAERDKFGLDTVGRGAIVALMKRHASGDFDATKEESDAWPNSPEGQETFKKLMDGK
jgi:hypothetical protein